MSNTRRNIRGPRGAWRLKLRQRRGVAAVLAMMFIILFGSLSAAMAIASRGNITTAASHLHVSRAQAAAETGLSIARKRLEDSATRFVVSESSVNASFGRNLWQGPLASLGTYRVDPSKFGRQDTATPSSLSRAIADEHALDQDTVAGVSVDQPTIGNAIAGAGSDYASSYWVFTPAVALETRATGSSVPPLAYSVTYAPLANGTDIRIISTGYDFAYSRGGEPIKRTVMEDFRFSKSVKHAIISPSRIMIGKNVMVTGDLGARYDRVGYENGDPLVLRSDFKGLDANLDRKLTDFHAQMAAYDVDGDNRLRVNHPNENQGIPSGTTDYDGDGQPDGAFDDITGDGYVDEFDVFIKHYDRNNDGKLVLSAALTAGTPAAGQTPEFTADEDLALLIDSSIPDRNRNGVWGFADTNRNGRWDAGEAMYDYDSRNNTNRDQVLGFRDGVIDKRDQYAKVAGGISLRVTQPAWSTARGSITDKLRGPIVPGSGGAAVRYAVDDNELPVVNGSIFTSTQTSLQSAADGASFTTQVAQNLGISASTLATYVESRPASSTQPRFLRLDADTNLDGLPDNWGTAYFEKMPFNSPNFADWYYRPVYENMTFKDVVIPMGNNGLFRNCTFIGVTFVRTTVSNGHVLWGEYGKMTTVGSGRPQPAVQRTVYGDAGTETSYPSMLPATAIPPNEMVLMAVTPLDKADIANNQVSLTQGYNSLPDPLVISGKRVTDTKAYSNNIRFHDCLFVGSIVSDAPTGYAQSRNKMQFTGATRFVQQNPNAPDDPALNPDTGDKDEIAKSSVMLPNYSVDLGTFNSPTTQSLELKGAVIAGVLDVRGNAEIDGALMLTYEPTPGEGPLVDVLGNAVGNPAGFNATLGYFGPSDGDAESLDPTTLPIVDGVPIVGYDTDGDGIADVGAREIRPTGSTIVPFNGYGRINLRFDPNMTLPNGIMLPMRVNRILGTYREGKP